ncbi:hypothetical protein D6C77_04229 [Aureobasidium pullulans]|uniref:Uncharacterized protein n=1 Tax=Aureobasidium pullulans TaxID=5580 RepID=A0AB74JVC3_AURPU|nr:hypothetical protein D6D12_04317 [Aureobasidium pullulans]THX57777.1 hypothetical protein D6D11_03075 [Aureobasidium pullulans]TIA60350.1 hypothetical protein D6C77_04229 [Aureobasidium pullulans]
MLRYRQSRVPLAMADVNQIQQHPRPKETSCPPVTQTDCAYDHRAKNQHQNNRRRPPQPGFQLRQGPGRSRDGSIVRLDPNRHVAHFAVHEPADPFEGTDTSEDALASSGSIARLVHIAEVSPTITQVPGYDPPPLLHVSPERPPRPDGHPPVAIDHFYQRPAASTALPRQHHDESSNESDSNPRSGDPYPPHRHIATHIDQARNDIAITTPSQRGQNPTAVSFAPRVHYGGVLREGSHHRSNIASVYLREGHLRIRPSSSRNSDTGRAEINHQTRSRPMPRPRGISMRGRPSVRGTRRPGGHIRTPDLASADIVRDRYPIFPAQSDESRQQNPFPPRSGSIPQRRGIRSPPSELRTSQFLYSQPRFSSTARSKPSVRPRASSNSLSTQTLLGALEQPLVHGLIDIEEPDDCLAPFHGSVRSSRVENGLTFWDRPDRRGSSHIDGYYGTDGQNNEPSRQPRRHIGIAARIADVEADCQSGTIRPPSLSASTQSSSSIHGITSSMLSSSPPGELPNHYPATPGRQLTSCARTSFVAQSAVRSQATPRVRVYNERNAPGMQPQTPADVDRKSRMPVYPESLLPGSRQLMRPHAGEPLEEQSPLIPARNPHRNTYPSLQQAHAQSHATTSQPSSPYSPNLDLRTAAAVSAVERRRTARGFPNENVVDPSTNGMETERDTLMRRREQGGVDIIDYTPPREGRYERYLS